MASSPTVTWKEFGAVEPALADVGRALLFQFTVEDAATRAAVLRDATHMADASETAFELSIDRVMHTRWEDVLTPQMRPVQRKWRAPGSMAPTGDGIR